MSKLLQQQRPLLGFLLISSVLLAGLYDNLEGWLLYQRHEILAGEYWRLLTGNFIHFLPLHFLLNLGAFILIGIYGRECPIALMVGSLIVCSLGVGLGLLWFMPAVEHYRGLSGTLHGLLTTIACFYLCKNRRDYFSWLVLILILLKVSYEGLAPAPTPTAELIGTVVVYPAHWFGALSGIVYCALFCTLRQLLINKKARPLE